MFKCKTFTRRHIFTSAFMDFKLKLLKWPSKIISYNLNKFNFDYTLESESKSAVANSNVVSDLSNAVTGILPTLS